MIKHIVLWRLNENAYGNDKHTNAQILKEKLLAMNGKVNGLLKIDIDEVLLCFQTLSIIQHRRNLFLY